MSAWFEESVEEAVGESAPVDGVGRPPLPERRAGGGREGVGHLDEMDHDIAARWDLWSVQIGHAIHPTLENLQSELQGVTEIMVCTVDGLNVVSLGLEDAQVSRLSALATSMFSVARAASLVTRGDSVDSSPQTLVLHDGDHHTVLLSMSGLVVGGLLLWVTARDTALGSLLVRSRHVADEITRMLQNEAPGA